MRSLVKTATVAGLIAFTGGAIAAAPAQAAARNPDNPVVVQMDGPRAARAEAAAALRQKAASHPVRVIVGLRLKLQPENELSDAAAQAQGVSLRAAQDAVLARVLRSPAEASAAASGLKRFDYIPFMALSVNAQQLERLLADPDVVNVQEEQPASLILKQSVPFIKADKLWKAGYTGEGITVAILDSGIARQHPMFAGKIVSEACYSTWDNASGSRPLCPGQATEVTGRGTAVNCSLPNCWHGSHVAGIAAGNSSALKGVAPGAKIIAIQIMSNLNGAPGAWPSDWVKGLERVYALRKKYKIAAANLSIAFMQKDDSGNPVGFKFNCDESFPAVATVVNLLRSANIATVAGTGNDGIDGAMGAPACISSVIKVGSTLDNKNAISGFSNHALWVSLMAPGSNITSAVPRTGYKTESGTSMATPHVTGALALLRDFRPKATVQELDRALECSGVPVTRDTLTVPRINVAAAKDFILKPPANVNRKFEFTSSKDAAKWKVFTGEWTMDGGAYNLVIPTLPSDDGYGYSSWSGASVADCSGDLTVTARFKWTMPDRLQFANVSGYAGIFYKARVASVWGNSGFVGYYASLYSTYDEQMKVRKYDLRLVRQDWMGVGDCCQGYGKEVCSKIDVPVQNNDFNTLRVVTKGPVHSVYINDMTTPLCTGTDYGLVGGRAGVLVKIGTIKNNSGFGFSLDSFSLKSNDHRLRDEGAAATSALLH